MTNDLGQTRTERKPRFKFGTPIGIPTGLGDRVKSARRLAEIKQEQFGKRCDDGTGAYLGAFGIGDIENSERKGKRTAGAVTIGECIRVCREIEAQHGVKHCDYDAKHRRSSRAAHQPNAYTSVEASFTADEDTPKELSVDQESCIEIIHELGDEDIELVYLLLDKLNERRRLVKAEEEMFERIAERRGANGRATTTEALAGS